MSFKPMAIIQQAHDLLHKGDVAGAHEALHCGINEKPLDGALPDADAAGMLAFSMSFTELCRRHRVPAAFIAFATTGKDDISVQVGGSTPVVSWLKPRLGGGV
jgi:hypothetical protein